MKQEFRLMSLPRVPVRAQFGLQMAVKRLQRLRNNPHVLQEGHEIRVTVPPRHEMPMEVAGKPRSRSPAEVESDVKAVRAQHAAVKTRHGPQLVLAAQKLGVAQLVQRPFMGQRSNEQVAVVVGKAVEDHKTHGSPRDDEILFVVAGIFPITAQEAAVGRCSRLLRHFDVREPPGSP